MPSGPGAFWGRGLERADAISSSVIEWDEKFSAGYCNWVISERSAGGMGGIKRAFRASHLASRVVARPWGVVGGGIEGSVGGKKLFDLAHFASHQKLFPPSLHAFSIALSKHCLFACLIAAPLALSALRYLLKGIELLDF
jgi:hypothetical protein